MLPEVVEGLNRLSLPVAQLLSRAINSKDARARHDNTFYLFEAVIKLEAVPGIAHYRQGLQRGETRSPELDRQLIHLALPSLGQWVGILRELARFFGNRTDTATHPLGHLARRFTTSHSLATHPAIVALYRRIRNGADGVPSGDSSVSLLQLFDALVQYRNGVFGHGGPRFDAFFEQEMGPLFFPAALEVLKLLESSHRLVHVAEIRVADETHVEIGLRELIGLRSERLAPLLVTHELAEGLQADRVALLMPGNPVPLRLDPLLLYRETDLGEEVLLLNRDRNGRQVEYLSYATGRTERDRATSAAMAELLATITGREVTEEQLDQFGEQSRAETPSYEQLLGSPIVTRRGNYEILGELGRGGMGVVYLARQLSLGRLVAMKMLPSDLVEDSTALSRFRREVRALSRCEHPNIVKVLASGTMPDRSPFYTMEYVPGCDLEHFFRALPAIESPGSRWSDQTMVQAVYTASEQQRQQFTKGTSADPTTTESPAPAKENLLPPLPQMPTLPENSGSYVVRIVSLIRDAALALQTVHDQQIIHRDIKPGNLMLTPDGQRIVLMDFGLAKGRTQSGSTSASHGFLGTLRYAAPEQLSTGTANVGPAADVRALGVTLWELLTRQRLFADAVDERQLTRKVLEEDVPPLRQVDPGLSRDLEAIVARATERRPEIRIASAGRLAEYLQLFLEHKSLPIRPPGIAELSMRWLRRHRVGVGATVAAVLLLLAVSIGTWVSWKQRSDRRDELSRSAEVDYQLALGEVHGDRFGSAEKILTQALDRIGSEAELQNQREQLEQRRNRVQAVIRFYRHADDAERLAASERDIKAIQATESALTELGIRENDEWWEHLPAEDLQQQQRERLQEEVFRQVLLMAMLRGKLALKSFVTGDKGEQRTELLQQAKENLVIARRFRSGHAVAVLETMVAWALGDLSRIPAVEEREPRNATDYYFNGFWHLILNNYAEESQLARPFLPKLKEFPPGVVNLTEPLATAEERFRMATRLAPRHYWTHYWFSMTLGNAKKYQEAETVLNTCKGLRPEFAPGYVAHASMLIRQSLEVKKPEEKERLKKLAETEIALARSLDPDRRLMTQGLVELYEESGDKEAAIAELTKAIEEDPEEANWFLTRGKLYQQQEAYAKATSDFSVAIRLEPGETQHYSERAWNYHLDDKNTEALADCEAALKLDPANGMAWNVRSWVYRDRGDFAQAITNADQAVKLAPKQTYYHSNRAYILYRLHRMDEALSAASKAENLDDTNADVFNVRGLVYQDRDEHEKAVAEFTKAIEREKGTSYFNNRARSWRKLRKFDECLADLKESLKIDAQDATTFRETGLYFAWKGEYDKAVPEYEKSIRLDPGSTWSHSHLAYAWFYLKKDQEAISGADQALKLDPDNAEGNEVRAKVFARKNQHKEAIAEWNKVLAKWPENERHWWNRARAYLLSGENEKAITDCTKALELQPKLAVGYSTRGHAKKNLTRYGEAIPDYTEAIRLDPGVVVLHSSRGECYYRTRDFAKARADFDEAIRLDPENFFSREYRTWLDLADRNWQKAEPDLDVLVKKLKTPYEDVLYDVVMVKIRLGKIAQARNLAAKSILLYGPGSKTPKPEWALLTCAMMSGNSSELTEALRWAEARQMAEPTNGKAAYHRMILEGRLGSNEKALEQFEKVVELYKGMSLELRLWKCILLHQAGREEEACELLSPAKELLEKATPTTHWRTVMLWELLYDEVQARLSGRYPTP